MEILFHPLNFLSSPDQLRYIYEDKFSFMGNLMNFIVFVTVSIAVFSVIITCGCVSAPGEDPDDDTQRYAAVLELMAFQGDVSIRLNNLGNITAGLSDVLTEDNTDEKYVTGLFDECIENNPAVYTILYIDSSGIVRINNSGAVGNISGMDLLLQDSVREQTERRVPMMTNNFLLHDGTHASAFYYPVFNSEGTYRGFVSLTFTPYDLVESYADSINERTGFSSMVAQPDGLVIYDPDPEEVGQETFGNPEYENFPEIIAFAKLYSEKWSGTYQYSFYCTGFDEEIRKEAFWTTVSMWDNNWRVFVIRDLSDS